MSLRVALLSAAAAVLLAACAHHSDHEHVAGQQIDVIVQQPAHGAIPAPIPGHRHHAPVVMVPPPMPVVAPAPALPPPVLVSWGEPSVVPHAIMGPQAVADTDGPYLLDSGDRLRIFVYGQPNLSRLYTVDHGGFITVPLIGAVKARGVTTFDLERTIKGRLGTQYVRDPHVTVDMAQNRPFFILGEVRQPGQYPYVSGMTLQTAVAIAGGFSERANERRFQITRRINGLVERIEAPDDYIVRPGDTVYVFERYF